METLLILTRFVHFAAVMTLFGSSLFVVYGLPKTTDTAHRDCLMHFVNGVAGKAFPLAIFSALVWLGCEAALMSGSPQGYRDEGTMVTVLTSTVFGHIWRLRLGIMAAFWLYLLGRTRAGLQARAWPALAGGFLLVATLAGVGHGAMGMGWDAWLHLGNQAVHMLAASAWVGGLLPLSYTAWYVRQTSTSNEILSLALRRFSAAGFAAVLLVVASGSLNAWFLVGSFHALLHTAYGQVLLLKLAFFLAMIGLALVNRLYFLPRLRTENTKFLLCSLAAEQGFALLAVAAVSVLGTMTPAFDMPNMAM